MARKKRHRKPIAPRTHSLPDPGSAPPAGTTTPDTETPEAEPAPPPLPPKPAGIQAQVRQRAAARERRGRNRLIAVFVVLGLVIVGAVVANQLVNRRASSGHAELAAAAGCGDVVTTSDDAGHTPEAVEYDTSPPAAGAHPGDNALPARVYSEPFSTDPTEAVNIYAAVHSLEHGYVIVWHNGLTDEDREELEQTYRRERKVIVVPYPELEDGKTIGLSAWARLQTCETMSIEVIDSFKDLFLEKTAPEPNVP